MASFEVNFTSYTLKRDVEITVVIPSMTILGVFEDDAEKKQSSHIRGGENILCCICCTDMQTTGDPGSTIPA